MKKVQITAVIWTMFLAIPMTALAISLAYYLTDHMDEMVQSLAQVGAAGTLGGLGWLAEFSARWPELVGMVVGQMVLMLILVFVRKNNLAENTNDTQE